MPKATILDLPPAEQAQMLAAVRRARYSYLLAMHILLLCAAQRTPTEIAAVLFCSRTTVYRVVAAYRAGQWAGCAAEEETDPACSRRRLTVLSPALKRSVAGHSAQRAAPVWVVSDAVELRHNCRGTLHAAQDCGVSRDGAAVAA